MMTIDEEIALERKLAEHYKDNHLKNEAREHEQLAEWLEELKAYRTSVFSGDMTQAMLKEERNKAIDDLIDKCKNAKFVESDEIVLSDIHQGTNSGLSMAIHFAEQLKVGESK